MNEEPLIWSYFNKDNKGYIYERIELFAILTNVTFERYQPFILRLLNIKVGVDGTCPNNINLIPKEKNGNLELNLNIFEKSTSLFALPMSTYNTNEGKQSINKLDSNVFCKTFIRDTTIISGSNYIQGKYTRIYTLFIFSITMD